MRLVSRCPTLRLKDRIMPTQRFADVRRRGVRSSHTPILLTLLTLAGGAAGAQVQSADRLSTPAGQIADDAIRNEVKLIQFDNAYLRYRVHTKDAKGDQIRDVVESKDGTVARVVMRDDRPLTADQDSEEHLRLQQMLDSPSAFQKHIQKDQSGKKLAVDLIQLLPEAMLFSYAPGQPQRGDKPPGPAELVIDFKPDPKWNPPTMTAQALTGLEGRCWIDAETHHLARLEGHLFQGVNFGFGVLAHIFPGGEFVLEQQPVGDGRWIVDRFVEHVTVRAMLVKTIKEDTDLAASEFAPIPRMGYQDAIHLLLTTPLPGASAAGSK
jgi:hypothetical protein